MWSADRWQDYELIDASEGEKLERWGNYILIRPDPQIVWKTPKTDPRWKSPDARYFRSSTGGGKWEFYDLPEVWQIGYGNLAFRLKPFAFKHTGLFPEQAVNWDWFSKKIKEAQKPLSILNLFAYTGGATAAAAAAGAAVCHVDAARGMVGWAKENLKASGLSDAPVRYIVDDCVKFVEREIRRGKKYDAVIMDPPSYGRGPSGEVWKIEEEIYNLVELCCKLLNEKPLFFLINSYTTGLAPSVLSYLLEVTVKKDFGGKVASDEIGLLVSGSRCVLPCGASGRWENAL